MEFLDELSSHETLLCTMATEKKVPINGILELTPLCNMNCEMCYVRLSPDEMKKNGRLRTLEEWLTLAEEMKEVGVLFLLLTGGEPLLYPDFKKLYLALKKMGMILTINTNGTLLDETWADFFAENKPRRINITLYGTDAQKYNDLCHYPDGFEKAVKAVKLLKNRGVSVKINGSIINTNKTDAWKIAELAKSLDVVYKIDTYMYPAERERDRSFNEQSRLSPEEAAFARVELLKQKYPEKDFLALAKQMTSDVLETLSGEEKDTMMCRAGKSSFAVTWQGNMRPCIFLSYPSVPVFLNGFSDAWRKIVELTEQIRLNKKCSNCMYRNACQICAACAFSETGTFEGVPQYMCRYAEESYRLLKSEEERIQHE